MKEISNRCPFCGKKLMTPAQEDAGSMIIKTRVIRFSISGGPLQLKCRHCGRFVETRFLRSYSE